MNGNNSNYDQSDKLKDELEDGAEAKHGDEGEAVHGGDQAGPNSSRGGQPIAPQMGDPRAKDRRPN